MEWLLKQLVTLKKRPRYPYLLITLSQLATGVIVFCLGISTFNTTPQYRVGGFWVGLIAVVCSLYRLSLIIIRMGGFEGKHKAAMSVVMVTLNYLCLMASICGAITDSIAAFLLQQIDFKHCSYTSTSATGLCETNEACRSMRFPQSTCFCCYIMEGITTNDCEVSLLTGRQFYYSEVESCTEIAIALRVKLVFLIILHLIIGVICIAGMCKTSPVEDFSFTESVKFSKLIKTNEAFNGEQSCSEEELVEEKKAKRMINSISSDSVL